jgi:hypothetical protein
VKIFTKISEAGDNARDLEVDSEREEKLGDLVVNGRITLETLFQE